MTTSSDEQYRIMKAVDGKNGVTFQAALDEQIDNGLDASADCITINLVRVEGECGHDSCMLTYIYNNGNAMTQSDRDHALRLDGRSKSLRDASDDVKGRYGIGGANARARLGGEGTEIITSKSEEGIAYQCVIDIKQLLDKNASPINCWTGIDSKHRPKWLKYDDVNNVYESGVTKEYLGNDLKQRFNLNDMMLHFIKKYEPNIRNGLCLTILLDDKPYKVPIIINNNKMKTNKTQLSVYDNNDIEFNHAGKSYRCKSGSIRTAQIKNRNNDDSVYNYEFKIIHPDNSLYELEMTNVNSNITESTRVGILGGQFVNEIGNCLTNVIINDDALTIACGKSHLVYKFEETDDDNTTTGNKTSTTNIEKRIKRAIGLLISPLNIDMGKHRISYKNKGYFASASSGDMGARLFQEAFISTLTMYKGTSSDLSQEDKSSTDIPKSIQHVMNKLVQFTQNEVRKELNIRASNLRPVVEPAVVESTVEPAVVESSIEPAVVESTVEPAVGLVIELVVESDGESTIESVGESDGESTVDSVVVSDGERVVESDGKSTIESAGEQVTNDNCMPGDISEMSKQSCNVSTYFKHSVPIDQYENIKSEFEKKFVHDDLVHDVSVVNAMVKVINNKFN